jgi:predicted Ser/Thr protein kinase
METLPGVAVGMLAGVLAGWPLMSSNQESVLLARAAMIGVFIAGQFLGGAGVAAWLAALDRQRGIPAAHGPPAPPPSALAEPSPATGAARDPMPVDPLTAARLAGGAATGAVVPLPREACPGVGTPFPQVPGYEVLGELGRGGMGVVYKARQVELRRLVALKMIRSHGQPSDARERFRTEARAIARLNHPHIVQVYETGEWDSQPYLALEYLCGGSLADHAAGRLLKANKAAELVEALARAVDAAHLQGVIHRDLKPQNVLLAADGTPKVADFGLARLADEGAGLTNTGDVLGTPAYMAPEQAAGKTREVGPLADVYSLGALLYHLLTGRPPFQGATRLATMEQVRTQPPLPPRRLRPDCPADLEAVCLCCLEKEPRRRYQSPAELAEDLCRFLAAETTHARPRPLWRRLLAKETTQVLLLWLLAAWAAYQLIVGLFFLLLLAVLSVCLLQRRRVARPLLSDRLPYDETAPIAPVRRRGQWLRVPLQGLRFPSWCSACGVATTALWTLEVRGRPTKLLLYLPVCPMCQAALARRRRWQLWVGLVVGLLAGLMLAWPYARGSRFTEPSQFGFAFGLLGILGAVLGALVGALGAGHPPVRARRYSWLGATVELWFRRRDYQADCLRAWKGVP